MTLSRLLFALILTTMLSPSSPALGQDIESFRMDNAYRPNNRTRAMDIMGHEPVDNGRYPVFVWTTGTLMTFDLQDADAYTAEMAQRGFVAASVEYRNWLYPGTCQGQMPAVDGIFNPDRRNSAINAICNRPKADCSQGIIVAGFSQGAHVAALAANYNDQVQAAYLMGNGTQAFSFNDMNDCLGFESLALPQDKIRSMVGAHDIVFGCDPDGDTCDKAGVREQQELTTGYSCGPNALECLQADGSGWYIVQDSEVVDGDADHGYSYDGSSYDFDAIYERSNEEWSLRSNLDWLASQIQ